MKKSKNTSQFEFKSLGRLKKGKVFVITEAQLTHIKSLARRAKVFITQEPRWNRCKAFMVLSGGVAITSASLLLPVYFGDNTLNATGQTICLSLLVAAISVWCACYYFNKDRDSARDSGHDSYISEIEELLEGIQKR